VISYEKRQLNDFQNLDSKSAVNEENVPYYVRRASSDKRWGQVLKYHFLTSPCLNTLLTVE